MTDLNTTDRLQFIAETQIEPSGIIQVLKGIGDAVMFIVTLYLLMATVYMVTG